LCPLNVRISRPPAISQSLSALASSPETTYLLSEVTARELTPLECPSWTKISGFSGRFAACVCFAKQNVAQAAKMIATATIAALILLGKFLLIIVFLLIDRLPVNMAPFCSQSRAILQVANRVASFDRRRFVRSSGD